MRNVAMFLLGAAVLVGAVGCPGIIGPPASAILAGDWTGTDADGLVVIVKFNDDGIVVSLAREDGVGVEVSNSTTELDGNAVTIVIGERTYAGTLSEDNNNITGTVDQEITVGGGDLVITIPAGDFSIDRIVEDLCEGNTCDDGDACNGAETCDAATGDCVAGTAVECAEGETCVNGACVAVGDLCEGNTCDDGDACNGVETCDAATGDCVAGTAVECAEGETCVNGACVAVGDLCEGNTCDDGDACNGVETCDAATGGCVAGTPVECAEGETCVDGACVAGDPCEGVVCADCESCVDGACLPLEGDAAAGETYYASAEAGCSNCHGPDGAGPPSLINAPCSLIFDKLTGVVSHVGGTRDITGQDAADLEAFLARSQQTTLFVVNNNNAMTSYANAGALNGEIPPTTRLNLGAATSLFQPRSIVVTNDGRLLISRQNGGIVGYDSALTADDATPADVVVDGNNTDLDAPISFAYDATNDRLYVGHANAGEGILVFDNVSSAAFDGDIAPDRTFGPPDRVPFNTDTTSISMTVDAMDLDSDGNLFVSDTSGLNVNQSRILVFADPGSAEGLAIPIQEFSSDVWQNIEDIVVDANDVFYVVAGTESVYMFNDASTLSGDVAPSSMISVQLDLVQLEGIVVGFDGTGYLAGRSNHAIYSYDGLAGLSGAPGPDRILEGFETRLNSPRQMFLLEQ